MENCSLSKRDSWAEKEGEKEGEKEKNGAKKKEGKRHDNDTDKKLINIDSLKGHTVTKRI